MGIKDITVVGGQMNWRRLTSKVDEKTYEIDKVYCWLKMINDGMRPKRWNKPNGKGTKVSFEGIHDENGLNTALDELEVFIKSVNRKHETDFKLNREGMTKE